MQRYSAHTWTAVRCRTQPAYAIAELLRHARELLEIIEKETAGGSIKTVNEARVMLAQLRGCLETLEKDVMPTRH